MSIRHFEGTLHAAIYSKFRPIVPKLLISRVINFLQEKYTDRLETAVDVGCGSGQSSNGLANHFKNVIGLDVSEAQIKEAVKQNSFSNVTFKISPAEDLPFENESVQLVTAGQACHWFDLPKFYPEVNRILVPNGVLAMYGYSFPQLILGDKSDELYDLLIEVYHTTKKYWGKERIYVDNRYTDELFTIPYTDRIREDCFAYEKKTTVRDLVGYISSWSGFQKYKEVNGDDAGNTLLNDFVTRFMETAGVSETPEKIELTAKFDFFLLMGRKPGMKS